MYLPERVSGNWETSRKSDGTAVATARLLDNGQIGRMAVLADYRGYDTMGEVTVIFTAGIGVMLMLGARKRRPEGDGSDTS